MKVFFILFFASLFCRVNAQEYQLKTKTPINISPDLNSKVKLTLVKGDSVFISDKINTFWLVIYNGRTGYISDSYTFNDERIREIEHSIKLRKDSIDRRNQTTYVKQYEAEKVNNQVRDQESFKLRRANMIKKYGKVYGMLIAIRTAKIGMTPKMILEIEGRPKKINSTVTATIVYEQWIYDEFHMHEYYYFINGKLSTYQN